MKSVFYCEDDFVAGLLKQYFLGDGNRTVFVKRSVNGSLTQHLEMNAADLFLAQSEDPEKLSKLLETVRQEGSKVPTLILTSQPERVPDKYKSFAHFVSMPELLESNLRWHIRLARTMRMVETVT